MEQPPSSVRILSSICSFKLIFVFTFLSLHKWRKRKCYHRETITVPVGNKTLNFETGKIARQANGSVMLHCGDTIVFASACASPTASAEIDFFPLRVDYQEKYSSAGRTAGGFIKREGRPSEREILACRLIDRPLRPMFEEGYYNEVQVLSYVFSYDGVHQPDVFAICAASAALVISDIPLIKPIGAVRMGLIDDQFVINPTVEEMKKSNSTSSSPEPKMPS